MSEHKQAAIYVRTFPGQSADDPSCQFQDTAAKKYCERNGFQIVNTYTDVGKSAQDERPSFVQMLEDAKAGRFDTIVTFQEDRLYRGVCPAMDEMTELERSGKIKVELVVDGHE